MFLRNFVRSGKKTSLSIHIVQFQSFQQLRKLSVDQFDAHLMDNELENPYQSSFRPKHSTLTLLQVEVTNNWGVKQ